MIRWILLLLGLGAVFGAVGWAWINTAPIDPDQWDVDPATVARTGQPNDYLVAPANATEAEPDRLARTFPGDPEQLLERISEIALDQPRTRVLVPAEAGRITLVQRTELMGFPDFITIQVVPVADGASLIVFSRSQYGYSDWGVNRERVEAWLSQL